MLTRIKRVGVWLFVAGLAACAGAPAGPRALDLSGSTVEAQPVPKWAPLRALLRDGAYDQVHEALERYRAVALSDPEHGEEPLLLAYQAFEVANLNLLAELDRWVRDRPYSWHAVTARAFCHHALSVETRAAAMPPGDALPRREALPPRDGMPPADGLPPGEALPPREAIPSAYAMPQRELTQEQEAWLGRYDDLAEQDAQAALKLQPRSLAAHHILLATLRQRGKGEESGPAVDQALAAFPASYALRFDAGWLLRLQAGKGNYAPLDGFVKQSQEQAAQNPRVRRLLAMPHWARGADLVADGKYAEAIVEYGAAIAIAEERLYLRERALARASLHDYRAAFADAKRFRELVPPTEDVAGPDELGGEILKSARAWIGRQVAGGDLPAALATLDVTLERTPDDAVMRAVRAMARCRGKNLKGAMQDFELARAKQPTSQLERLQAACVASGGKPLEVIRRAEARLLEEPGNGQLQFDLGQQYALVADVNSAIAAYRVACALEVEPGCQRVERLGDVARRGRGPLALELRPSWTLHPQERLRTPGERHAFFAGLEGSDDFQAGGPPVKFKDRVLPELPAWTRGAKPGSVTMLIFFNADGTVAGARVEGSEPQGYYELAATRAVLRWTIEPREAGLKARQRIDFKAPEEKPPEPDPELVFALAR